jgi:hypothetical protein
LLSITTPTTTPPPKKIINEPVGPFDPNRVSKRKCDPKTPNDAGTACKRRKEATASIETVSEQRTTTSGKDTIRSAIEDLEEALAEVSFW